jgi:hypothetical protein
MIKSNILCVKKLNTVQYMMLFNTKPRQEVDLEFLLSAYPEKKDFVLREKLYNYLQKLIKKEMTKSELFK